LHIYVLIYKYIQIGILKIRYNYFPSKYPLVSPIHSQQKPHAVITSPLATDFDLQVCGSAHLLCRYPPCCRQGSAYSYSLWNDRACPIIFQWI